MTSIHELVSPVVALVVLVLLVGMGIELGEALYLCAACLVVARYVVAAWHLRKE